MLWDKENNNAVELITKKLMVRNNVALLNQVKFYHKIKKVIKNE